MRHIQKSTPPHDLVATAKASTTNLSTVDGARTAFNQIDKASARERLAAEQRGLCAFCCRRVVADQAKMKIAHRTPIAVDSELALTWNNLLGCCRGGEGTAVTTCDTAQGSSELTLDPTRRDHVERVRYSRRGCRSGLFIDSDDGALQTDVDLTLKLNAGDLPECREAAWKALRKRAMVYGYGKPGLRQCLESEANNASLREYFGVLESCAR